MNYINLRCFLMYGLLIALLLPSVIETKTFPDAIELVGYNSRHARMPKDLLMRTPTNTYVQPPLKKQRADIERVKQNIEEYNKLLKIDTKKLSDQQKVMLERIVERVARLKETLEIDAAAQAAAAAAATSTETVATVSVASYPDTTIGTTISASSSTSSTSTQKPISTKSLTDDDLIGQRSTTIDDNDTNDSSSLLTIDDIEADTTNSQFLIDETTFVPLPSTENDARSSLTTILELGDEARANTKIDSSDMKLSTISGIRGSTSSSSSSTTSNKYKNRQSTTKKPLSTLAGIKSTTSKRITTTNNIQHHSNRQPSIKPTISSSSSSSSPAAAPAAAAAYSSMSSSSSTSKMTTQSPLLSTFDFSTITTIQPQSLKQTDDNSMIHTNTDHYDDAENEEIDPDDHFKTPQQSATISNEENNPDEKIHLNINEQQQQQQIQIQQRTPINSNGIISSSDLIYDPNVTATSIIDSLSNHAREDYYNNNNIKPSTITTTDTVKEKKPASGTAKPTKYHYYPHNQHIYLLPECAIQQVCNAVYVRLNYTQPLCACPSRYRDPCSASLNEDDQHTTKLIGDGKKKAITLAKTCEATTEMRECRSPKDWSLLALQNTRTGKSHYLVICRCPDHFKLEGPMAHDQPTYASVPGIRVFGMMCVKPGYAVRKPSIQPPKRYQLHKPYYISNTNKYGLNKDSRPSSSALNNGYQQQQQQQQHHHHQQQQHDSYQLQHQANYQYLNRPETSPILTTISHTEYPDSISINSFNNNNGGAGGGYGRNNERKGELPIEAVTEEKITTTTTNNNNNDNDDNSNTSSNSNNSDDNQDDSSETNHNKREKRSINYDMPEFPLEKLIEFQQSVVWDEE